MSDLRRAIRRDNALYAYNHVRLLYRVRKELIAHKWQKKDTAETRKAPGMNYFQLTRFMATKHQTKGGPHNHTKEHTKEPEGKSRI